MADRQSKLTSIFETVGDFVVSDRAEDKAEEQMGERTSRSQRRDRSQRAPVTTDYDKWAGNTDHWDFPGVDTPRQDPRVKPKDLKQSDKPRTTDTKSGEAYRPRDPLTSEKRAKNTFKARASSRDVSLATEEAFQGQFANDPQAIGGLKLSMHEDTPRETDRPEREQVPPDIARGEGPSTNSNGDGSTVQLSPWSASKTKTALNRQVHGEGRDEFEPVRQKFSGNFEDGLEVELTRGERQKAKRALSESLETTRELSDEGVEETLMIRDVEQEQRRQQTALAELTGNFD